MKSLKPNPVVSSGTSNPGPPADEAFPRLRALLAIGLILQLIFSVWSLRHLFTGTPQLLILLTIFTSFTISAVIALNLTLVCKMERWIRKHHSFSNPKVGILVHQEFKHLHLLSFLQLSFLTAVAALMTMGVVLYGISPLAVPAALFPPYLFAGVLPSLRSEAFLRLIKSAEQNAHSNVVLNLFKNMPCKAGAQWLRYRWLSKPFSLAVVVSLFMSGLSKQLELQALALVATIYIGFNQFCTLQINEAFLKNTAEMAEVDSE